MGSTIASVPLLLEDQEDLIREFTDAAEAIAVTIHAQDVVNNVFLGP